MTLGFLMSGPKSGYKLKNISGKMMLFYSISLNQIYPILRKLEEAGYVRKEIVIQTGKPNKNLYSLTEAGKKYFIQKMTAPAVPFEYDLDFLVRAVFFRFLDSGSIIKQFEEEIYSLEEQLEELEQMEDTVNRTADIHGKFSYRTAVYMLRSLIEWYKKELQSRKNM
jgi:DNA-binding PadR family transcriptional regulator